MYQHIIQDRKMIVVLVTKKVRILMRMGIMGTKQ